jgi:hypothetical protein
MKIQLEAIASDDERTPVQLEAGEVVEHEVIVGIDGTPRTFRVYLQANVKPTFDASMLYGDPLLEELLRFEPRALSILFRSVGKHRSGAAPALPIVLVDSDDAATA